MKLFGFNISRMKKSTDLEQFAEAERLMRAGISRFPFLWQYFYGRDNVYAQPMDYYSMVRAYKSWVYVCASRNATTVSQTPLKLYVAKESANQKMLFTTKAVDNKKKDYLASLPGVSQTKAIRNANDIEEIIDHPYLDMMHNVNPYFNQFDSIELTQLFLELTGNAYWYLIKNKLGVPAQFWVLPSQHIRIVPDKELFIKEYQYYIGMEIQHISTDEIVHFKFTNPNNMYYGMSPLEAAATAYNLSTNINNYETAVFKNNGMMEGYFTSEVPIDDGTDEGRKAKQRLEAELRETFGGVENAGKNLSILSGLTHHALSLPPKEMGYLRGREWTKEEIINCYGQTMGMYSKEANRANSETADYLYRKDTIFPRSVRIQEKINEKVLPMYDERLFCAFDNPVPFDREFRLKERDTNIRNNSSSINIERQKDSEDVVPWGDEPLVPFGIAPLSVSGQMTPTNQSAEPKAIDKNVKKKAIFYKAN